MQQEIGEVWSHIDEELYVVVVTAGGGVVAVWGDLTIVHQTRIALSGEHLVARVSPSGSRTTRGPSRRRARTRPR